LGDLAIRSDSAAVARGEVPIDPYAIGTNVDAALQARGLTTATALGPEEDEDDE
jgi:hypothetical protein